MRYLRFTIPLLFLFAFILNALAGHYIVTAGKLNVRQNASSNSKVVFKLSKGDIVEGEDHGNWTKITFMGETGYAYSKYLETYSSSSSSKSSNSSNTIIDFLNKIKIWYILLAIVAIFFIHKRYGFKMFLGILIGSGILIAVFPPLGAYIGSFIGLSSIGRIIGWLVAGFFILVLLSDRKDTVSVSSQSSSTDDYSYNDYDSSDNSSNNISSSPYYDVYDDADEDTDDYNDDGYRTNSDGNAEYEKWEKENRATKYEDAKREYEYYYKLYEEAKERARTERKYASDYLNRAHDYKDEMDYRAGQECLSNAKMYDYEASDYKKKADFYKEQMYNIKTYG